MEVAKEALRNVQTSGSILGLGLEVLFEPIVARRRAFREAMVRFKMGLTYDPPLYKAPWYVRFLNIW